MGVLSGLLKSTVETALSTHWVLLYLWLVGFLRSDVGLNIRTQNSVGQLLWLGLGPPSHTHPFPSCVPLGGGESLPAVLPALRLPFFIWYPGLCSVCWARLREGLGAFALPSLLWALIFRDVASSRHY